jgi:hypothetical protein
MALGNPEFITARNSSFGFAAGEVGNDNKNQWQHSRIAERFPYLNSPAPLAVFLMRLLNVGLGAITLVTSTAIFRILWPERSDLRLLALGALALWPNLIYRFSTLNNDNGSILTSAFSLLLLLRQIKDGVTWRDSILLGLVLGAGLLSKTSGFVLAIPVGAVVLINLRKWWKYAAATLGVTLLVASWWYVRNLMLYQDLTAMSIPLEAQGGPINPNGLALDVMVQGLPYVYDTFWARFGNNVVPVGPLLYRFYDMITILALIGAVVGLVRNVRKFRARLDVRRQIVLATTVFGLSWLILLVYVASTTYVGSQGRYLQPAAPAIGALISFGLTSLVPGAQRVRAVLSALTVMGAAAIICLFGYFLPAYRPLAAETVVKVPLSFRFEDTAELIGMSPAQPTAHPGETITITLTWRAIKPTATSLSAFLHSIETDLVRRDSIPGTGNLLSTEWLPGETWSERYIIPIPDNTEPGTYTLIAGLYDREANHTLNAVDANGNSTTPVIGQLVIVPK